MRKQACGLGGLVTSCQGGFAQALIGLKKPLSEVCLQSRNWSGERGGQDIELEGRKGWDNLTRENKNSGGGWIDCEGRS